MRAYTNVCMPEWLFDCPITQQRFEDTGTRVGIGIREDRSLRAGIGLRVGLCFERGQEPG